MSVSSEFSYADVLLGGSQFDYVFHCVGDFLRCQTLEGIVALNKS